MGDIESVENVSERDVEEETEEVRKVVCRRAMGSESCICLYL